MAAIRLTNHLTDLIMVVIRFLKISIELCTCNNCYPSNNTTYQFLNPQVCLMKIYLVGRSIVHMH